MKLYSVSIVQKYVVCEIDGRKSYSSPEDYLPFLKPLFQEFPGQEQMRVIFLNARNRPIGTQLVTVGTATASLAHPREVFRGAIVAGATSIVISHNHPSGDPQPSGADFNVTRQLREAGNLLGISLLDHIVIGEPENDPNGKGFYSFREAGLC